MLEEKVKKILQEKSKNTLLALAENVGTKGYSKLSKVELLRKLLTEEKNHLKLKQELGFVRKKLIHNGWIQGLVFLFLSSVIGYGFFYYSPSKNDIQVIEDKIDRNEQYKAEIEYLEKYKKKFLSDEMPVAYKVFGILDGKMIMKEELANNSWKLDFESKIELNFNKRKVRVNLLLLEFSSLTNQNGDIAKNINITEYFPMKVDEPYNFKLFSEKEHIIRFVLLKEDKDQPIFAIGFGRK